MRNISGSKPRPIVSPPVWKNRSTTFWAWVEGDWHEIFAADSQTFMQKHGRSDEHRLQLVALAYLLCNFQGLDEIGRYIHSGVGQQGVRRPGAG
jgi:hypothetical protein